MRIPRVYQACPLGTGTQIQMDDSAAHHVRQVLRLKPGASLIFFNGQGGYYHATIAKIQQKNVFVDISEYVDHDPESPLNIHLGQALSRTERMDFVIQKAVELGVTKITPVITERCSVKLTGERAIKKVNHWQRVIISACEQSGRTRVPEIVAPVSLDEWLQVTGAGISQDDINSGNDESGENKDLAKEKLNLMLVPDAQLTFAKLGKINKKLNDISLLVGPEGGLSEAEIKNAKGFGVLGVGLGPRILRTETAALVAISILQERWGDLSGK